MSTAAPPEHGRTSGSAAARVAAWIGLLLHVAVGVIPYAGSGLVAPPWGMVLLWASWALLLGGWALLRRRRPWLAAAVPFVALAWWVGVVTVGETAAGWTA